ncbi:hypothetical protein DQ353_09610 [Arthrobacter sp. AQ5-05]|uniref:hypothetical protein n=1 Tax=Arthrobacter sp. AQ5-05 TaxID=2184581 RepID=UPI000DCAFE51|nr:hypothetical protein [Arthrobacter sp. AQ5-05]RAX49519.1 hypothetical protein DQ353_09610 [Arthrobacter sp. AQ5-05]
MSEGIWHVSTRPRSQKTHQTVLDTTNGLLREKGLAGVTIERPRHPGALRTLVPSLMIPQEVRERFLLAVGALTQAGH